MESPTVRRFASLLEAGPPPMGTAPFVPWGDGSEEHVMEDISFPGPNGENWHVETVTISVDPNAVQDHRATINSRGVQGEDLAGRHPVGILDITGAYDLDTESDIPITKDLADALWEYIEQNSPFATEPLNPYR